MNNQFTYHVLTKEEKTDIRAILKSLTEWFGIDEALEAYVIASMDYEVIGCFKEKELIGFMTLKPTSTATLEIYVMGIYETYHRQHIGKEFIQFAIAKAKKEGYSYLQVKTLDPSAEDPFYMKTHAFYCAMGFQPVETLPLWDEWNPCLLMILNVL